MCSGKKINTLSTETGHSPVKERTQSNLGPQPNGENHHITRRRGDAETRRKQQQSTPWTAGFVGSALRAYV